MFSRRGPILIVISLLLAVGAAWVANRWLDRTGGLNRVRRQHRARVDGRDRHSARHQDRVTPRRGHPDACGIGARAVPSATSKAIEGKVALSEVMKGEMLLGPRFADQGGGSALAAVVAADMRAVSVRVNDVVGVAGFLLPGNRVDVVAAYRERTDTHSETVVQNVKVLAIDQSASSDKNEPVVVRAVTLEVTPADAEKLILAEQRGSIQLALRNPLDEKVTQKPVAAVAVVVKTKAPPPAPGVAVIRGTEMGKEAPKGPGR